VRERKWSVGALERQSRQRQEGNPNREPFSTIQVNQSGSSQIKVKTEPNRTKPNQIEPFRTLKCFWCTSLFA